MVRSGSVELVRLADVEGDEREEALRQLIRHLEGAGQHAVGELLQQVLCSQRTILVDREVLLLHLLLTLCDLLLEPGVGLLDHRGVAIVVGHAEDLDVAELPVRRLIARLAATDAVGLGVGLDPLVEREEDAECCHSLTHIVDLTDLLGEAGATLQDMGLSGAEDRDRAPRLLGVAVEVGVVLRVVVVRAEALLDVTEGELLVRLEEDGEVVLRHVLLLGGSVHLLQVPDARVAVGGVELLIPCIGLVEVEVALIEVVLLGEVDQILGGEVIGLILGVVVAEAALVAGDEVLVLGDAGGEPAVTGGGLEVPHLVLVDEADAEALSDAVLLDQ